MEWYAVFVKTGKEEEVQEWLSFHFDECTLRSLVPKRRIKEKKNGESYSTIRKLFPGYVFIETHMDLDKYKKIRNIPSIIRILNTDSYYSQIDNEEMSILLKLTNNDSIIGYSKVFVKNSKVLVKEGPLCGLEGIIKKIDKHKSRAKIQLDLIGDLRIVDVGIELLYELD